MSINSNTSRFNRRIEKHLARRVIKAAKKYDIKGCEICGHQPMGRETYLIGKMGNRMVGVCNHHRRHLDSVVSVQFYFEGEENIRRRKMAERAYAGGVAN